MDITAHHGAYFIKPSLTDTGLRAFMIHDLDAHAALSARAGRSRRAAVGGVAQLLTPARGAAPPCPTSSLAMNIALIGGSGGLGEFFEKGSFRYKISSSCVYHLCPSTHDTRCINDIANHGSKMPHDGSEYTRYLC